MLMLPTYARCNRTTYQHPHHMYRPDYRYLYTTRSVFLSIPKHSRLNSQDYTHSFIFTLGAHPGQSRGRRCLFSPFPPPWYTRPFALTLAEREQKYSLPPGTLFHLLYRSLRENTSIGHKTKGRSCLSRGRCAPLLVRYHRTTTASVLRIYSPLLYCHNQGAEWADHKLPSIIPGAY